MADPGTRAHRWVVAGGGTGGHVMPALAIAEQIAARGDDVLVLGGETGLETRLVPEAGYALVELPARQFMGRGPLARLAAVPAMLRATARAFTTLRRFGAEIVISIGGYASVPAVAAAALLRVPIALVEPNAVPGRANRAAARFAKRIFVQFEVAGERLAPAGGERVLACGIPLRQALVRAFADAPARREPARPFRLLVFGGSQGAHQINEAVALAAAQLDPGSIEIAHQTGAADLEAARAAWAKLGASAEVAAFFDDMPERYAWADLALCRSGAITVAELALAGLPALLAPYPFAADDHQAANARALAEAGAARLLTSRPLAGDEVRDALARLFASPETLREMSERARALARPDAAAQVVENCASLFGATGSGNAEREAGPGPAHAL